MVLICVRGVVLVGVGRRGQRLAWGYKGLVLGGGCEVETGLDETSYSQRVISWAPVWD